MADEIIAIEKETDKVGRPCKYESHVEPYLDKVYKWVREGNTDYSIADNLGISYISLIRYKKEYDNLASLYTRATGERNRLVMNKMFLRASGEKVTLLKQKATKDGDILDLKEETYIPPDVNAADLFLRNNDPEYKQAKQVETGQNININFQLPEARQKVEQLLTERQKAKAIDITSLEVVEVE